MLPKKSVLILCTANSARSQMAEGLLKHICQDKYIINSAGTVATKVRPEAIAVLSEIGVDISKNRSKSIDEFDGQEINYVLTVCDSARENCPYFPANTKLVHHSFEDPASVEGKEELRLKAFRKIRDQIDEYLRNTFLETIGFRNSEISA